MTPSPQPTADPTAISTLVKKCASLCENADTLVSNLPDERETFLAHSLGDTLQQLELILRALSEGTENGARDEERSGLLRRLFARKEGGEPSEGEDFTPPKFDVSQQGLQGNSWTVSLSELLGFLAYGRKTGVLWVDAPDENFLIGLVDGHLMHATSSHTPEGLRLGEVLVSYGFLTNRQLDRFLAQQEGGEVTVSGEALLEAGMISDDELRNALAYQSQQLFHRLVQTNNAVFRFREGMQIPLAYHVNMDINTLLLDSARVHDEAATEMSSWEDELSNIMGEEDSDEPTGAVSEAADADAAESDSSSETTSEDSPDDDSSSEEDSEDSSGDPSDETASSGSDPSASSSEEGEGSDSENHRSGGRTKRGRRRR